MNIYLLEDDPNQLNQLEQTIIRLNNELKITPFNIAAFTSTDQLRLALPIASRENLFILDLEINGDSLAGLDFSQTIRKTDSLASIIFITVHDNLLYTTYKSRVRALDFIAKDRGQIADELKKDLVQIQSELNANQQSKYFHYKDYSRPVKIPISKICFFKSNPENSHSSQMITTDNEAIQLNYNLRELGKMSSCFFRAHRSYLINPALVRNVDLLDYQIIFRTGATCPLSRRKANKLLALLKK